MRLIIMWGRQRLRRRGWWQERGRRGGVQSARVNTDGVAHSKGIFSVHSLTQKQRNRVSAYN